MNISLSANVNRAPAARSSGREDGVEEWKGRARF